MSATFKLRVKFLVKKSTKRVHKLVYCDLPKAGSSVWMKIMLFLSQGTAWRGGNVHKESMVQNTFLYSYLPDDQIEMLKTHYKFMFVRHPFERLLSGFRNKVRLFNRPFGPDLANPDNERSWPFGSQAKMPVLRSVIWTKEHLTKMCGLKSTRAMNMKKILETKQKHILI